MSLCLTWLTELSLTCPCICIRSPGVQVVGTGQCVAPVPQVRWLFFQCQQGVGVGSGPVTLLVCHTLSYVSTMKCYSTFLHMGPLHFVHCSWGMGSIEGGRGCAILDHHLALILVVLPLPPVGNWAGKCGSQWPLCLPAPPLAVGANEPP